MQFLVRTILVFCDRHLKETGQHIISSQFVVTRSFQIMAIASKDLYLDAKDLVQNTDFLLRRDRVKNLFEKYFKTAQILPRKMYAGYPVNSANISSDSNTDMIIFPATDLTTKSLHEFLSDVAVF